MSDIILRVPAHGVKAVGAYLAADAGGNPLAYRFPGSVPEGAPCTDAELAAEVQRLQDVKGMSLVEDPAEIGPKGKVIEADLRWVAKAAATAKMHADAAKKAEG